MGKMGEMQGSVYVQPKGEVDGSHHSKEGSKYVEKGNKGSKGIIVYITIYPMYISERMQ